MANLVEARELKKKGKRVEARNIVEEVLKEKVTASLRVEALELLQIMDMEDRNYDGALKCADTLIEENPKEARFYNNRGIVMACVSKLAEATEAFTKALELQADHMDASMNLAKAWMNREEPERAIAVLEGFVQKRPYLSEPYRHLGNLYEKTGQREQAEKCQHKSSWLNPRTDTASKKSSLFPSQIVVSHLGEPASPVKAELAQFLEELLAYAHKSYKEGKLDEARGAFEAIVGLDEVAPVKDLAVVYATLGEVQEKQHKQEKALDCYRKAIELMPKNPRMQYKLAELLGKTKREEEAKEFIGQKLATSPQRHDLREILGRIYITELNADGANEIFADLTERFPQVADFQYMYQVVQTLRGDYPKALAVAERLLAMHPEELQMRFNRSLVQLGMGNFEEGWKGYETRKLQGKGEGQLKSSYKKALPVWRGESLEGKRLAVFSEQGLGDIINFVRLINVVKKQAAAVAFKAAFPPHDRILPLIRSYPHADQVIESGIEVENFDYCVDLLSMPGVLKIDLTNIPGEVPYLFPEKERDEQFKKVLANLGGFKIGIAWQGNPKHARDKVRSFPLEKFKAIAEIPGVHLVKLQKNVEAKNVPFPLVDLGDHLDKDGAFVDTAAVIKNLDLVICCDSAICHLTGALGMPIWLALSVAPDWRWLTERKDSPWYPTMRIFRQKKLNEWDQVLEDMARALREEVLPRRFSGSVSVDVSPGELLDKISILQIKKERMSDPDKLRNVIHELECLEKVTSIMPRHEETAEVFAQLKKTNETLWVIEDDIRLCERERDFGPKFIDLARSVYKNNDHRAVLKRKINEIFKSSIVEEKSYTAM